MLSHSWLKMIETNRGFKSEIYFNGAAPASMKKFVPDLGERMKMKLPEGV